MNHIIAFYLPQFYPTPENDEWWGKGFTEWTNVGKAKPLFKGHNQPRIPTELGYYDLRLPQIREQQVELAKEAGVTAFCYWHYWLGNGRRLLADIFNDVLESGKPNFPFCLGWANHSWYAKDWNADGSVKQKLLAEQVYPGVEDAKLHFNYLLKAFKDSRYLKIDGMPLLYIFNPNDIPAEYLAYFKTWAKEAGFPDLLIVGRLNPDDNKEKAQKKGCDLVTYERFAGHLSAQKFKGQSRLINYTRKLVGFFRNYPPFVYNYANAIPFLITRKDYEEDVIPMILPQWDHTPRSGRNGTLFINATPSLFYNHAKEALKAINQKPNNRKIVFVKSWNEWGEGNYMEPDLTYGRGFIYALKQAIEDTKAEANDL